MKKLFPFLIISFGLIGCRPSTLTPTLALTSTPTREVTELSLAATITPTATINPNIRTITPSPTVTPTPPVGSLPIVREENGWITYRNEILGYEITVPEDAEVIGFLPSIDGLLLGPGFSIQEISDLLSERYGDRLCVSISYETGFVGVEAYDIVENDLEGWCFGLGIGDFEPVSQEETLVIDGQTYEMGGNVWWKDGEPVYELTMFYLEKDGIQLIFGSTTEETAGYQMFLDSVRSTILQIVESYKRTSSTP